MPERDALNTVHEHPRRETFVEGVEVTFGQCLEQPNGHMWGRYRGGLEQLFARGERLAARARTASRTVAGTLASPAASASVAKKGFPPVLR